MKSVLILILCFPLLADAQKEETDALYFNLGIKRIKLIETKENQKKFILDADSVYFNGLGMSLNKVKAEFQKDKETIQLSIGDNYSLIKQSELMYLLKAGEIETKINLESDPKIKDPVLDGRFLVMAILLNLIEAYNLEDYSFEMEPNNNTVEKRCGTWEVTGYGHSQTGSMLNAFQQAHSFENNNANCGQSGGASVSCIVGQHFCFTTYTFYCQCNTYIPFLGIGW